MQVEALDERTRIDLWNFVVYSRYLDVNYPDLDGQLIWTYHFGFPRDRYGINELASKLNDVLRKGEWYEVYDLLEFLVRHTPAGKRHDLANIINNMLSLIAPGTASWTASLCPSPMMRRLESIAMLRVRLWKMPAPTSHAH